MCCMTTQFILTSLLIVKHPEQRDEHRYTARQQAIIFVMVTPGPQINHTDDGYGSQFEYKLEEESITI